MPILNAQVPAQGKRADGTTFPLSPTSALVQRGPVVQVTVSVGQPIAAQVLQSGGILAEPVSGLALVDTGATVTCVDETAAQRLQLPVVDVVNIASASQTSVAHNVYPIQIEVVGLGLTVNAPRAVGAPLESQGILVLIGRDVLRNCVLVYNGLAGLFTLSI